MCGQKNETTFHVIPCKAKGVNTQCKLSIKFLEELLQKEKTPELIIEVIKRGLENLRKKGDAL